MDLKILVQDTPNPNAMKFILNKPVKREGKVTYHSQEECANNIMAHDLMGLAHVESVHFFENTITVTQSGEASWDDLEWLIKAVIETRMPIHDPDFSSQEEKKVKAKPLDPELQKIDDILDRTVRIGLQMDGGDIELLGLQNHILAVRYLGACGTCPSSSMGTLQAIQSVLRAEYHPEIEVVVA